MEAGKLSHLISLEKYVEGNDEFGQPTKGYQELFKAWAEIRPLLGYEHYSEMQVNTDQTHRIKVRYRPGIEQTMRFKYGMRYFEVIGSPANYMERNIFLFFRVKEVFDHHSIHPEAG